MNQSTTINRLFTILSGLLAFIFLFFAVLALGTVPAPNGQNSTKVTGRLVAVTAPHPDYGDMSIILDGNRGFYVNRANEVGYFEWEAFLEEVSLGDEVTITGVDTLAKRWFGFGPILTPAAGVETADKIYMDTRLSATRWQAQGRFARNAVISGLALLILILFSVRSRPQMGGREVVA